MLVFFVFEILYGYIRGNRNEIIIIGGDFNMDEKFQKQLKEWGLLAREMKKRIIYKLGYIDVLFYEKYENASTFSCSILTKNHTNWITFLFKRYRVC